MLQWTFDLLMSIAFSLYCHHTGSPDILAMYSLKAPRSDLLHKDLSCPFYLPQLLTCCSILYQRWHLPAKDRNKSLQYEQYNIQVTCSKLLFLNWYHTLPRFHIIIIKTLVVRTCLSIILEVIHSLPSVMAVQVLWHGTPWTKKLHYQLSIATNVC